MYTECSCMSSLVYVHMCACACVRVCVCVFVYVHVCVCFVFKQRCTDKAWGWICLFSDLNITPQVQTVI